MTANRWAKLKKFLSNKNHLLISTHTNPDGDGLGSQVALAEYMKQLGKRVELINNNSAPAFYNFLDPHNEIKCYKKSLDDTIKQLDGVIIVDISDWERLGLLGKALVKYNIPIACIDHHIPGDTISDVQILDQTVSSTGELIYEYLTTSQAELTPTIVSAIYTCLLTDTGSFRFSNTTSKTHQIAADLLHRGVDFTGIYKQIYETQSKNRVHLTGQLMANLNYECNDRLVWYVLSKELIQQTGIDPCEVEGLSELTRYIQNIEISIMFTEVDEGTKISLRSRGKIPINGLAGEFGGGGHMYASGALIKSEISKTIEIVLKEAKKLLQ